MRPAKSRGHALARKWLAATAVCVAALAFRVAVFAATGSGPAFTGRPLGVILIGVTAAVALITGALYAAMFLTYLTTRDVRRGHAPGRNHP